MDGNDGHHRHLSPRYDLFVSYRSLSHSFDETHSYLTKSPWVLEYTLLPFFSSYPHLFFILAQFPRAGTNGVFNTRYMLCSQLTYSPRLGPRRRNFVFLKISILNQIVFVHSFCCVSSLIFCIVKNAGKLSPEIAPPPSRWFQ